VALTGDVAGEVGDLSRRRDDAVASVRVIARASPSPKPHATGDTAARVTAGAAMNQRGVIDFARNLAENDYRSQ